MNGSTQSSNARQARHGTRLFLCGDVMLGRGIDQVLPHPCDPVLHESCVQSAAHYVRLAEMAHGSIPRRAGADYVWGAALDEFSRMQPDARIINLETSITRSENYARKGINYRMSPENAACLKAAAIDCCVLGNNHILDWGRSGLIETLSTLEHLNIKIAGVGRNLAQASMPAALDIAGGGRVLVFSFGCPTSGIPDTWAATNEFAGVNVLNEVTEEAAECLAENIARLRGPDDLVIVSLHWGPNWGYCIPAEQRDFAHALIDRANVSVVHGHSSHHPKSIEIYRNRLILYGCGDFLNDYEGITGYEKYRDDLVLMYFVDLAPGGGLAGLEMVGLQIRNFHLVRPSDADTGWIRQTLDRECRKFGNRIAAGPGGRLTLE